MKNSNIKKYIIIFISMIALLVATISFMPKSTKGKAIKFKNDSNIETKLILEVFNLAEKQLPNHKDLGFVNIKNADKESSFLFEYILISDSNGIIYLTVDKFKTSEFKKVWWLSYFTMYHLISEINQASLVGGTFTTDHAVVCHAYALYIQDLFFKSKTYLNAEIKFLESGGHPNSQFKKEIMKTYLDLKNGLEVEKLIKNPPKVI